jgi:site-specific DNA-cytosine methylase
MKKINVLSLFDGMSCGQIALNKVGIEYENYFASEIDKYAISVTQKNYPFTKQLGSITELIDVPKADIVIGGSPCQSFSMAGKMEGFDGKSGLFWEYVRCLEKANPKYFLLENVVMKKEWEDIITKALGVQPIKINSRLVSGQNRPRLYWTNIPNITQPKDKNILLNNIIDTDVEKKYYLSEKTIATITRHGNKITKSNVNPDKSATIHANYFKMGGRDQQYIYRNNRLSKLTPNECEKLQTVPMGYTNSVSDTQRYKMIGNGWTVDVIAHILSFIK